MKSLLIGFVLMTAATSVAAASGFNRLASHRAVYNVSLISAEDRSGIAGMDGRMVYELRGNACEGMSMQYRFVTRIGVNGEVIVTDHQMATHESPDGREFSFSSKSFVNEQRDQDVSGLALQLDNGVGVTLNGKKPKKLNLPDALFSTSHLVAILGEAEKGRNFVSHTIFDGGGEADHVVDSTAVIGKTRVVEDLFDGETGKQLERLRDAPAWPVTLSYFDTRKNTTAEAVPTYEATFLLYANGVSRNLTMRYPDYALKATLAELEFLESGECNQ